MPRWIGQRHMIFNLAEVGFTRSLLRRHLFSRSSASNPRLGETAIFFCHLLNPESSVVREFNTTLWLSAIYNMRQRDGLESMGRPFAFLTALGLSNASPDPIKLLSASFAGLHELLAQDRLSYEDWLLVERHTPDLHWLRHWDKCERLRRGLAMSFVKNAWPPDALLSCVGPAHLLARIASSAYEVEGGKKLVKNLIRLITSGSLSASDEQRKALQIKNS